MAEMTPPALGRIVADDEKAYRDAIHVAVACVVAGHTLAPGWHVLLDSNGKAVTGDKNQCIGVVDPYLRAPVQPGQRFWLLLYPNTVTSLRHAWTHPAFKSYVPERMVGE